MGTINQSNWQLVSLSCDSSLPVDTGTASAGAAAGLRGEKTHVRRRSMQRDNNQGTWGILGKKWLIWGLPQEGCKVFCLPLWEHRLTWHVDEPGGRVLSPVCSQGDSAKYW